MSAGIVIDGVIVPLPKDAPPEFTKALISFTDDVKKLDNACAKQYNKLYSASPFMANAVLCLVVKELTFGQLKKIKHFSKTAKILIISMIRDEIKTIRTHDKQWKLLASKLEFTLHRLNQRTFPFYKSTNEQWKNVANVAANERYPGDEKEREEKYHKHAELEKEKKQAILREERNMYERVHTNRDAFVSYPKTEKDYSDMFELLIRLNETELLIEAVNKLLISLSEFGTFFKHPQLLSKVFKYIGVKVPRKVIRSMRYTSYLLLKEERHQRAGISSDNRAIFTEDQFRALPVVNTGTIQDSPYFAECPPARLEDHVFLYAEGKRNFTSRPEFLKRMHCITNDMLYGIELCKYDAFMTGSALVPCVVTNPLEKLHKTFKGYIERYYPSNAKYKKAYSSFVETRQVVQGSLVEFYDDDTFSNMSDEEYMDSIESMKKKYPDMVAIIRMSELAYEKASILQESVSDIDIGIVAVSKEAYDKKVFAIFDQIKENLKKKGITNVYLYEKQLQFGTKWVLRGDVDREIDFFKITCTPAQLMHRFHVNIVKFWWDGQIVRGLYSGVCAALTGINQWYRYFSNNKNPVDIIFKYVERGYTTLLSKREIQTALVCIKTCDKYKSKNMFVGGAHITHEFFGELGVLARHANYGTKKEDDSVQDNLKQHWSKVKYPIFAGNKLVSPI